MSRTRYDALDDAQKLKERLDRVVMGVKREVESSARRGQDADVPLYHYTTQRGFLGILQSQVMFATDARFLNDSEELRYVDNVLASIGESLRVKTTEGERLQQRLQGGGLRENFHGGAFIASFSEVSDSLSQWRAYAGDGSGYVVGLPNHSHLLVVGDHERPPSEAPLVKVEYNPVRQRALLGRPVRKVVALVEEFARANKTNAAAQPDVVQLALGAIAMISEHLAPSIKHPGFAEEREWRAVVRFIEMTYPGYPLQFRPSRYGLAPYLQLTSTFDLTGEPRLNITEAVLGPKLDSKLGIRVVKYLLRTHGQWPAHEVEPPRRRPKPGQAPRVWHSKTTYR